MSLFSKTRKQVDELEKKHIPDLKQLLGLPSFDRIKAEKHVHLTKEIFDNVSEKVDNFKGKADEKDPDKKIYGTSMIKKIGVLYVRFGLLRESFDQLESDIKSKLDALQVEEDIKKAAEEEKKKADAKKKKEAEEKKKNSRKGSESRKNKKS